MYSTPSFSLILFVLIKSQFFNLLFSLYLLAILTTNDDDDESLECAETVESVASGDFIETLNNHWPLVSTVSSDTLAILSVDGNLRCGTVARFLVK